MVLNKNQRAFFSLIQAGLWERDISLSDYGEIDYLQVHRLAEQQSVTGLVAAGLDHITDLKIEQENALAFAGSALQLELRNKEMNAFIARLFNSIHNNKIRAILLKGQGVAQCYERPLWRECGDVDIFINKEDSAKAKEWLIPFASSISNEKIGAEHLEVKIGMWDVEIQGSLKSSLSSKINRTLNDITYETFYNGEIKYWENYGVQIPLLSVDNEVIYVFLHFMHHFFRGGVGLRQICDWCRLLWINRKCIDKELLKYRLFTSGIESEWKAFAALAVEYLGMPQDAVPLYSSKEKWSKKARRIMKFVLETGNFGHNRDYNNRKYPYFFYKSISLWRHTLDVVKYFSIFPLDSIKLWWRIIVIGFNDVRKDKLQWTRTKVYVS